MERSSPIGFAGKLQASKDGVQRDVIKFVLDRRQFIRERRACHQCDPFSDCLIFKERVENTSVSVVSWSTEKNLFAMTIVKTKLYRRCEILVSDVISADFCKKRKKGESIQLRALTFDLLIGTFFATPGVDKIAHGVDGIKSTNKLFKRCRVRHKFSIFLA